MIFWYFELWDLPSDFCVNIRFFISTPQSCLSCQKGSICCFLYYISISHCTCRAGGLTSPYSLSTNPFGSSPLFLFFIRNRTPVTAGTGSGFFWESKTLRTPLKMWKWAPKQPADDSSKEQPFLIFLIRIFLTGQMKWSIFIMIKFVFPFMPIAFFSVCRHPVFLVHVPDLNRTSCHLCN